VKAEQYIKLFTNAGVDPDLSEFMAKTLEAKMPDDVAMLRGMIEAELPDDVRPVVAADRFLSALVGAFARGTVEFMYAAKAGEFVETVKGRRQHV
jgi:hypothetical protein